MKKRTIPVTGILIILILFLCATSAFPQDSSAKISRPVYAVASLLYDFPESYGMTLGIQFPFQSINKELISRSAAGFTKRKDMITGFTTGFYRYPYNNTGIILSAFIASRRYYHRSLFTEIAVDLGMLRTFYDGRVYKVDAAGNIMERHLFGRFYATTGLSYSFDWLLSKTGEHNIALQLRPSLWFQYPYNSFIKPHASLEAGIKYEIAKKNVLVKPIHKSRRK